MSAAAGRIVCSRTQRIAAPPDAVFPLICPVREAEWLDGWGEACTVVHAASGLAEPGGVFRTRGHGDPGTTWIVTRHDADAGVVEFARVTGELVATTLRVAIAAAGDGTSAVEVAYAVTPLSPAGAAYAAERFGGGALEDAIDWWETSMNAWLATGERLPAHAGT